MQMPDVQNVSINSIMRLPAPSHRLGCGWQSLNPEKPEMFDFIVFRGSSIPKIWDRDFKH
jgi:hypothetical protein